MRSAGVTAALPRAHTLTGSAARFAPGALAPAAFSLLGAAVFTRLFDPGSYGRYALALSACVTIVAVATQWLQQSVLRFVPAGEGGEAVGLRQAVALAVLLTGSGALLAGTLFHLTANALFAPEWRGLLLPAILLVTASAMYQCVRAVIQADRRSGTHSVFQTALAAGSFILGAAGAMLWRDPAVLLWSVAATTMLLIPVGWRAAALPPLPSVLRERRAALQQLRPLVAWGAPMAGWFIATRTFDLGARLVIELQRGSGEVGVYSASYALTAGAAGLVVLPLNLAMHPLLMGTLAAGRTDEAALIMARLWNTLLLAAAVLVGWAVILAPHVAGFVLGPAFHDGFRIIPVVLAGVLVWQLAMLAHKPLEFAGRTRLLFGLAAACALLNLALNVWLVRRWGFPAAAYVTAGCYGAYLAATLIAGRRRLAWPLDVRFSLATVLVAGAGFAIAVRLGATSPVPSIPGIAAALVTTGILLATNTPWSRAARLPWRRTA